MTNHHTKAHIVSIKNRLLSNVPALTVNLDMNQEEKKQLQKSVERLLGAESVSAIKDMISILCDCLFDIMNVHGREAATSRPEAESKIVLQMIFSKMLYLKRMMDGVGFQSRSKEIMKDVIDPTVIAALCRTIFETVAMFNLIYIIPKSDEEKKVLYNMWVISGLKYRQRFSPFVRSDENKQKQIDESNTISKLIDEIKATSLYQSLDSKNQAIIEENVKRKDYKVVIENNLVTHLSWEAVIPVIGIREDLFRPMYTYFSLYSHPSNVAVFQFADLFNDVHKDFINMSNYNGLTAIKLASFFIADYIKLFPSTNQIFESLPLLHQIMINFHSRFLRADKSTINNAINVLH